MKNGAPGEPIAFQMYALFVRGFAIEEIARLTAMQPASVAELLEYVELVCRG